MLSVYRKELIMRKFNYVLSTILFISISTSITTFAKDKNLPDTASNIDISRYMGIWHEVARLPMLFQNSCVDNISARYSLNENNSVNVINQCRRADNKIITAEGIALAIDHTNSKLKVTFLPKVLRWLPFTKAPYWILRLDENYQTALVGTPNRQYLWLLSRNPKIDEKVYQSYLETAQRQGYDLSKLIRNP